MSDSISAEALAIAEEQAARDRELLANLQATLKSAPVMQMTRKHRRTLARLVFREQKRQARRDWLAAHPVPNLGFRSPRRRRSPVAASTADDTISVGGTVIE